MGRGNNSGLLRRAYYPSGPWIDGIKPAGYAEDRPGVARVDSPGNPNPDNYQLIKVQEDGEWLIVKIKYPDCTNFEGAKILIFKNPSPPVGQPETHRPTFFPGRQQAQVSCRPLCAN